jgi:uncharacterized protein (DUF885 family)
LREASAGVVDEALAELLRDHWAWVLERQPLRATRLGVHRFDDRLAAGSYDDLQQERARRAELLQRARAIGEAGLSPSDRTSRTLFIAKLESARRAESCDFELWSLNPRSNPITRYNNLPETHTVGDIASARRLLARYQQIPRRIDETLELLGRGAARGLYANAESTRRLIDMAEKQLAQPLEQWPMLAPVRAEHRDWPAAEQATFARQLRAVVEQSVKPALQRYLEFLRDRILPHARDEAHSGLAALPLGEACYAGRIEAFTTLELSAAEVHRIGMRESARVDREMAALGEKVLAAADLDATLARLRSDPKLYFESEDQVEQAAADALALAKRKMPAYFGVLPKTDCIVRRVPDYEATFTPSAYYRPPRADGSKPGEYFVNVYQPRTRPRFEARVLAVHESIPGHHLQIAIAQELEQVPAFRKHGSFTAYIEGWALYTERLADEMGMYANDLDRMGMLSFDAWRASRLVVDTGIHAMGWSRAQAKRFMAEHTALTLDNIDNEVDRYINWPGQALGYKIGQLEIWKLRREAEAALGTRFDLRRFHDAVLGGGPVSLPVLRTRVADYISRQPAAK